MDSEALWCPPRRYKERRVRNFRSEHVDGVEGDFAPRDALTTCSSIRGRTALWRYIRKHSPGTDDWNASKSLAILESNSTGEGFNVISKVDP